MSQAPDPVNPVRVGLISLGCAKNLVDAEIMLGSLLQAGMQVLNDPAQADVVIVNTCSFIDAAQEESVDTILESAALREARHQRQALVVSGCLPQRFRDQLPKAFPEVDAFIGIDQVAEIPRIVQAALERRQLRLTEAAPPGVGRVRRKLASSDAARSSTGGEGGTSLRGTAEFGRTRRTVSAPGASGAPAVEVHARPSYIPDVSTPRLRLTPDHFAYVKIAEGCNHPCSFCIIPRMRGRHRSRAQDDVVKEVRQLVASGVREINLISQDSTFYGLDLRPHRAGSIAGPAQFQAATLALPTGTPTLVTLLRELNALPGDFWIRLLYTHPAHWTDELIRTLADCRKVARYVDMPLQHIHNNMLQAMRRETSREHIEALIDRIRGGVPGIALRTTFIVGFPGETEACFAALLDFMRQVRFDRLGVFTYSREDGTVSARMGQQVPEAVRQERRAQAMAEQRRIARQLAAGQVGRELKVLTEGPASGGDLEQAGVRSWEHGLIRSPEAGDPTPRGVWTVARGEADAPDIDGRVYVRGPLTPGRFVRVRVIGHTDYDLMAEPVARRERKRLT